MDFDFFIKRPFLKEVAEAMQDINDGKISTLAVSMPPRSGKSYTASLFCAWTIGNHPSDSVMRNCCTATLYNKFSYDVRDIVKSNKFIEIFPNVQLAKDKQAVTGWNTTEARQVTYFGNGVGGTIIGFGATKLALTDDLYKGIEDALSETVNDKTHQWKEGSHNSRLEKNCPSIDIGTRWSKRDVIGVLEEQGYYDKVIRIKALVDGKSFCEDVKTTEEYKKIYKTTDRAIVAAEYDQEPIEVEGLLFPISDLNKFSLKDFHSENVTAINGAIDTADEGGDSLCFPTAQSINEKIYITDVVFTKDGVEISLPTCASIIEKLKHSYITVETNSGGKSFARDLRRHATATSIIEQYQTANKQTRILMQAGFIKEYFYFRDDYEEGSDYDRFIKELTGYIKTGKVKHDDAPDGLAMLAEHLKRMLSHLY